MTRPRWPPELVAQLIRRNKEDGVSLEALGKEYGISRQAMWAVLNWDTVRENMKQWKRRRSLARKAAKLAKTGN